MFKDKILAGTISGMIASLAKTIPNLIFYKMGLVNYLYFQIAAAALIRPEDVNSAWGLVIGVVVDIITGGTLGLLTIYLLQVTGRDLWWYKGLIIGNVIWLFGLGLALNFGASRIVPVDPVFRLTSLVEHQIFGLIGAFLIIKWYPETSTETPGHKMNLSISRRLFPEPARKQEKLEKKVRLVKPKKI